MREDGALRRPLAWLKEKAPHVHRFLVRRDKPYPMIREGLGIVLGLILLASLLWGLTGQSLGDSPVVVIESGSMMHCDQGVETPSRVCAGPFGRLGTIDPGDLVFVRDTDGAGDVTTFCASAGCTGLQRGTSYLDAACGADHHGSCGDVIIFIPDGDGDRTPIIHRAMVWVEVHEDGTFSIEDCGLHRVQRTALHNSCLSRIGITGLQNEHAWDSLGPDDSGFLTRGDNNAGADQPDSNAVYPVQPDWILGKARGEVPWVGLIKLFVSDLFVGTENFRDAPGDTKFMMWVVVAALVGAPFLFEQVMKRRGREPPGGSGGTDGAHAKEQPRSPPQGPQDPEDLRRR